MSLRVPSISALSELQAPSSSNQSGVMDGRRQRGRGGGVGMGRRRRGLSRPKSKESSLLHLNISDCSVQLHHQFQQDATNRGLKILQLKYMCVSI